MKPSMKNLLEELNTLAATKIPYEKKANQSIVIKTVYVMYAIAIALLIISLLINWIFTPSPRLHFSLELMLLAILVLPIIGVCLLLVKGLWELKHWRKEYFESFIAQVNFDEKCSKSLMKYSTEDLERAKLWIKGKLEKETWKLSLLGTDKISLIALFGLAAAAWANYEKLEGLHFMDGYHKILIYVLALFSGIILGSILARISHSRYLKMQIWVDLALFEQSTEENN